MLLALDTSTAWASLALYDGRSVTAELSWQAERRHGDELFPMLERVLALGRVPLAKVERIAVALGPGSFTGVRIALATAKGLARGGGAALAGVGTLDVIGYAHEGLVCALLPAGSNDFYAAFFEAGARVSDYIAAPLADIASRVEAPTLFAGEIDEATEATLRDLLGARARVASPAARPRRAGYLAELGWRELEAGRASRVDRLEPIYVREASVRPGVEKFARASASD